MTLLDNFINALLLWLPPTCAALTVGSCTPKQDAMRKYLTVVREHWLLTK
jgi:hypothetical protein